MPGRTLIIRPGLIVGPFDPTDRFTYWPVRVDRGGEVLAPSPPENPVQVIDVRDLALWIVKMAESSKTGIYNATGPQDLLTMEQVLAACKAVASSFVQPSPGPIRHGWFPRSQTVDRITALDPGRPRLCTSQLQEGI